jgi:hypothetical protein
LPEAAQSYRCILSTSPRTHPCPFNSWSSIISFCRQLR